MIVVIEDDTFLQEIIQDMLKSEEVIYHTKYEPTTPAPETLFIIDVGCISKTDIEELRKHNTVLLMTGNCNYKDESIIYKPFRKTAFLEKVHSMRLRPPHYPIR